MAQAMMSGTRLAYVVVPIKETVKRIKQTLVPKEIGKLANGQKKITYERKSALVEEPGGFMVYFPRGHALRIKNESMLKHYGLNGRPRIINLEGLNDPNSPLGQLMSAQDEDARRGAMDSLEAQVVKLATAKTGKDLLTPIEKEMTYA